MAGSRQLHNRHKPRAEPNSVDHPFFRGRYHAIDDIHLFRAKLDGSWLFEAIKIEDSPYYQCLACYEKDPDKSLKIFSDYAASPSRKPAERTYQKLISLYENIRDNGFDYELHPKIRLHGPRHRSTRAGQMGVRDGQHRVVILKHLGFNEVMIHDRWLVIPITPEDHTPRHPPWAFHKIGQRYILKAEWFTGSHKFGK